jgi:diadenosine tetraphosphate (Ap4A) HIT family hydrolase
VTFLKLFLIKKVTDLTESARHISKVLETEYTEMKQGSIWLIQDGKEAGQTVRIILYASNEICY